MLSNVISAGKDIANKISNKILNLSEIEAKIKEATNDDQWGPQGSLMKEISDETFSSMNFNEVMTFLWYRLFSERPINARRTYKGLVLLTYMLINGSEYVAIRCRDHIDDIRRLESFCDSNGTVDFTIRKKARDLADLITNSERLNTEREKAKTNQKRLYGHNSSSNAEYAEDRRAQNMPTHLGDFDSWQPRSKSIPVVIGESFINFVNTFTQNISGPPPTETHDNFDLPSYYDGDEIGGVKDDVAPPSPTFIKYSSKPNCQITVKTPTKPVEPVNKVDDEVPIIDFSEPAPATESYSTNLGFDFSNSSSNAKVQEDDFGDFSSWDKVPHKPIVNQHTGDFFPDFDTFVRSPNKVIENDKSVPPENNHPTEPINKEKTNVKLGSTWNDIGSLKIDLDNVVGGRRPMYSKS